MNLINGVYIKDYEWESFDFPLKLTSVTSEFGYYNFPTNSVITIKRDELFNIKATIEFTSQDKNACEYKETGNYVEEAGQFIEGENIIAYSSTHKYILKDCTVAGYSIPSYDQISLSMYFVADLLIYSITEINKNDDDDTVNSVVDWFLTSKSGIMYQRKTDRLSAGTILKVRKEIDEEDPTTDIRDFRGGSWDFFFVELDEFSFIVQETPKELLPEWAYGICIEYRKSFKTIPSEETRRAISEIISFSLGIELIKVGTSEFNSNKKAIRRYAHKLLGDNIIDRCQKGRLSPMHFKRIYARDDIEDGLKDIIPTYLKLRNPLGLNTAIWKYWIGRNAMIGTNLPIMSSSIEGIAEKYLKYYNKLPSPCNEDKRKYNNYLLANKEFIEGFKEFGFTSSVINKINNPYNLSGGEKMKIFFESLGINFDKKSIENQALMSRNSMAHSSTEKSIDEIKETIRLTRAYETLFNRVMLKILNYKGKYIDHYTFGHPALELSENIKVSDNVEAIITDNE